MQARRLLDVHPLAVVLPGTDHEALGQVATTTLGRVDHLEDLVGLDAIDELGHVRAGIEPADLGMDDLVGVSRKDRTSSCGQQDSG